MTKNKTKLLPIYSIQTNMVQAFKNITTIEDEQIFDVLVMLATGKQLIIRCEYQREMNEVFNSLHFYPGFEARSNNSIEFQFEMEFIFE